MCSKLSCGCNIKGGKIMTKSILLVGVGGQGTILASKLLTEGLIEAGYDVKMAEIHGMSQRGGSVSSQVRYGEKVYSPVVEEGGGDVLIAFEKMEALRWLKYLKPNGMAIVNDYEIESMPIKTGKFEYPEDINDELKKLKKVKIFNAAEKAVNIGNEKVMNVILLGSLIKAMELEDIDWKKIITNNVKEKFIDINIEALKIGMKE
jgi:indolepyruvate ferredoxin oxidoreductase beta subunit